MNTANHLKPYDAYKPSGIEWIGEIPAQWEIFRGLKIFAENKRKNTGLTERRVLSLSYGNIIKKSNNQLHGLVPESFETYQIVKDGDIIIRCTDLQNDKTSLRTSISNYDGIITSAYLSLKILNGVPKYIHYLLRAIDTVKYIYKLGSGLRQNLSFEDFKNLQVIFPPIEEQTKIADFLDRQSERIDRAVRLKKRIIERLEEQRRILIHRAVTRGLDPHTPTKPSGIDWIGEMPTHWEVKRFRHLFDFSKGLSITKENLQDEGIPCVNYGEIHSKYGFCVDPITHKLKCVDEHFLKDSEKSLLKKGDFVFADTSEDIEGSGNFTVLDSNVPTFAGYHTIIARHNGEIDYKFLAFLFDSDIFRNQIRRQVKGVKVYSITNAILKDTWVWHPPSRDEQVRIVEYIEKETAKIDQAVALQRQEIEKLKEYKASLIDSAVTGKVKVA